MPSTSSWFVVVLVGFLLFNTMCEAAEDGSLEASEAAALENYFVEHHGTGIFAIWPRHDVLARASHVPLSEYAINDKLKWFKRVLKEDIQPQNEQWSSPEWLNVPDRWRTSDYLIGRFSSRAEGISRIEFQASRTSTKLTLISQQLFPNREFSEREVLAALRQYLNIPEECIPHLKLQLESGIETGTGVVLTYGKVFDSRDVEPAGKNDPPLNIPEKKREWFSPMSFCVFAGRLSVSFSTIDWESDDRPAMRG